MNREAASCHCGNISAITFFADSISQYSPRACDCDFCTKHGAAYVSDPDGKLKINIRVQNDTTTYQQGSGLVDLLICKVCGVLVAVTYLHDGRLIGGLNSRTLVNWSKLPQPEVASPKLLTDAEKIKRWSEIWFPDVTIEVEGV